MVVVVLVSHLKSLLGCIENLAWNSMIYLFEFDPSESVSPLICSVCGILGFVFFSSGFILSVMIEGFEKS